MANIVEYNTSDGPIWIEVEKINNNNIPDGWEYTNSSNTIIKRIDKLSQNIDKTIDKIFKMIKESVIKYSPNEFSFEIGLKISVEAGAWVLAKAAGEANIKITCKWNNK